MPTTPFWTTQHLPTPVRVLEHNTPADQLDAPPQFNIRGASGGAAPADLIANFNTLYPVFDGVTNKLSPPPELSNGQVVAGQFRDLDNAGLTVPVEEFMNWHSAHQLQYLHAHGGKTSFTVGSENANFLVNSDGTKVIYVESLQIQDIAKLSVADQNLVIGISAFADILQRFNLTSGMPGKILAETSVTDQRDNINATSSDMSAADKKVFTDQLENILTRIDATEIYAPDVISKEAADILTRFKRANAFASIEPVEKGELEYLEVENDKDSYDLGTYFVNAKSMDGDATIKDGYKEFMRLERSVLAMDNRRSAVVGKINLSDPKVDVPNLIFQLQSLYKNEAASLSDADTEEIRQQHKLLKDYAVMQRIVNETIKFYDPDDQDEERRILNVGAAADDPDDVDTEQGGFDPDREGYAGSPEEAQGNDNGSLVFNTGGISYIYEPSDMSGNDPFYPEIDKPPKYSIDRLSEEQALALSMFNARMHDDDTLNPNGAAAHPLETLNGIDRPKHAMLNKFGQLELHYKTSWDSFLTQLADAVTIINQNNQITQNDINSASKRENRHFDLANNALSKMHDMLQAIGRM